MKIAFFGSGKFAVGILSALHSEGHTISIVVTQPDRKKGRHLHLTATPVKEYAVTNNLTLFQPNDVNSNDSVQTLEKIGAEIFVVVSYGRILSETVLAIPSTMAVNIHASLLPKYRGAAPINRALMAGEKLTGVTFIKMNRRMDEGDIIFQKSLKILKDDTCISLDEKLSRLASENVNLVLKKIAKGKIRLKKQNNKKAVYAPLMKKHDGLIHWEWSAEKILNYFRGCYGWPSSFTYYKGKLLKILSIEACKRRKKAQPGEILSLHNDFLEVACGKGSILIKEVLPESHHRMSVRSFLSGHHVAIGEKLSSS